MKNFSCLRPYSHLLLILLIGGMAYSNSFQAPFTLDDLTSIVHNPWIGKPGDFLPGGPGYEFMPRRWVVYLSLSLNHYFGGLEVGGYHLVNLSIHLATALLVYALVILTFRTPNLATSRLTEQAPIAALLFVAHPVQTQAVTYVVQRLTSLATFFYLASLVLYVLARLGGEKRRDGGSWQTVLLLTAATMAALLAMKSKEIAFTLPLAAALYEWCFFRDAWSRRLLFLLPLLATLLIIPLGIMIGAGEAGTGVGEQLRAQTDIPRLHYLITQLRVIVTYLRLLILPLNQNLDYDYPIFTTFLTLPVILSCLLLLGLLLLAGYLFHRSAPSRSPSFSGDPALRLVAFGIFWFFLTLAVESSFVPILDVIFEHRLYLPLAGLAPAIAVAMLLLSEKSKAFFHGRIPLLAAALIIISLSVATWQRNAVWADNITLWQDVLRKSPGKVRPWYNLGCYLYEAGRAEQAIRVLSQAVRMDPEHADAWHNLGLSHLLLNRVQEAVPLLRRAVRLNPELSNAIANLAVALIRAGQPGEAILILERNIERFAAWPEVHLNLGIAYAITGNLATAQRQLAVLDHLAPHLTPALRANIAQASSLIQ